MQVGMIGLGRMGANMTRRLMHGRRECVVHDVSADAVRATSLELQDRVLSAMRFGFGGHVEKVSGK